MKALFLLVFLSPFTVFAQYDTSSLNDLKCEVFFSVGPQADIEQVFSLTPADDVHRALEILRENKLLVGELKQAVTTGNLRTRDFQPGRALTRDEFVFAFTVLQSYNANLFAVAFMELVKSRRLLLVQSQMSRYSAIVPFTATIYGFGMRLLQDPNVDGAFKAQWFEHMYLREQYSNMFIRHPSAPDYFISALYLLKERGEINVVPSNNAIAKLAEKWLEARVSALQRAERQGQAPSHSWGALEPTEITGAQMLATNTINYLMLINDFAAAHSILNLLNELTRLQNLAR